MLWINRIISFGKTVITEKINLSEFFKNPIKDS
jgi:hypothetical protein